MMGHQKKIPLVIAGVASGAAVLALVLASTGRPVDAMEPGTYEAPDISRFIVVSEEDGDGDGDGVKETHIRRYRDLDGDSAFSMTTGDRLWAWSLESQGSGAEDPARNFVIRDSDCDGTFDERYGLDEEFHVPDCVK